MATNTFYPKQNKASLAIALPNMARWFNNHHATLIGPAWTIISTYSQAAAVPHENPPDPTDIDSLAADNSWRSGVGLVVGDYIILQSTTTPGNPLQLGIAYQGGTTIRFITAPYLGFNTLAPNNDMNNAGNWANPRLSAYDWPGIGSGNYTIIADEDRAIFVWEDGITYRFSYSGYYDGPGYTNDLHPVIQYYNGTECWGSLNSGVIRNNSYNKISAVDNATEISLWGSSVQWASTNTDWFTNAVPMLRESGTNSYCGIPVSVYSNNGAHYGQFGNLRQVWVTNQTLSAAGTGTLGGKQFAYVLGTNSQGPICFPWDGVTTF